MTSQSIADSVQPLAPAWAVPETLSGVVAMLLFRKEADLHTEFVIARLQTGEVVKGEVETDFLVPGLSYRFSGRPKTEKYRGQEQTAFYFKAAARAEPHSRSGIVFYLQKFAPGVGPSIAGRLFDLYEADAVKMLRTNPERCAAEVKGLTVDVAREAAGILGAMAAHEDVRIELGNILEGRKFPKKLPDILIRMWGVLATKRLTRDPFSLLVHRIRGCGFKLCDRLYTELGLPLNRPKRVMICIWNLLKTDTNGHTWHALPTVLAATRRTVSLGDDAPGFNGDTGKVTPDSMLIRAIQLGIRARWLAATKDADGKVWIAEGSQALAERRIAEHVGRICGKATVLPLFTEHLPGECGSERDARGMCPDCMEPDVPLVDCFGWPELGDGRRCVECVERELGVDLEDSIEQKVALGRQTGVCQFCGRKLVNEESVQRGYGPYCAAKWGLPWGDSA